MEKAKKHTIQFPLDDLVDWLIAAGFTVSTRQRLHAFRILQQFGTDALQQPAQLKYRLCPIFARSANDQEQFHKLFDDYLVYCRQYEPPKLPSRRLWKIGLGIATVLLLAIAAIVLLKPEEEPPLKLLQFEQQPPRATIGQPITFKNTSIGYDSTHTRFRWEIRDAETDSLEYGPKSSYHWGLTIDEQGLRADKQVVLIAYSEVPDTLRYPMRLHCSDPPPYTKIVAPAEAPKEEAVTFRPDRTEEEGLEYIWDFGDGDKQQGFEVSHPYKAAGSYMVSLTIKRPEVEGYCSKQLNHRISIGAPKAFLANKALQKDEYPLHQHIGWLLWILPLLLVLLAVYYAWRWWKQPPPKDEEAQRAAQLNARFAAPAVAPYTILYRGQDALIRPGTELYGLAQRLRLREEGLRKELDIPATISGTIAGAGFPNVHMRRSSVPPSYLFLIDEQAPHSHQAQLYRYLLEFLKGQDVYIDAFWYKENHHRFWNAAYPKGISLEQLQQRYPRHRLLVLGSAHGLIDPFASQQPPLQLPAASTYHRWKNRLLLTPISVSDWTSREAALYELFALFPADSQGVQAAMAFMENEQEEEDQRAMPSFREWSSLQQQPPLPPTANYRPWKRLQTYEDYFAGQPRMLQWCYALALCPTPTWPLTLAIGAALGAPRLF